MQTNIVFDKKIQFFLFVICTIITSLFGCSSSSDDNNKACIDEPEGLYSCSSNAAAESSLPDSAKGTEWTIMFYGDGDNNLDEFLLYDIEEMKAGFINDRGINLIVLVDRASDAEYCNGFNEVFTDTRLYQISHGKAKRISGSTQFPEITTISKYEANMGDAITLQKFIQFCKANYPADNDNYALILWNHGSGPDKKKMAMATKSFSSDSPLKGICVDDSNGYNILHTAEITDVLNSDESVNLIGFDACIMGSVEVAYQYRPDIALPAKFSAQIMVASPSNEWSLGWSYRTILERFNNPAGTDALGLGRIIVESQRDSTQNLNCNETWLNELLSSQTMSCYDLTKVDAVKNAVDILSAALAPGEQSDFETIRGFGYSPQTMHYFNASSGGEWAEIPFFDLYDLCARTNASGSFIPEIQNKALAVMNALDGSGTKNGMIKYSFGGSEFSGFQNGKNGVYIFFPDGEGHNYSAINIDWAYQSWYNAISKSPYYGKLSWCDDDASSNSDVENWFEMLDSWFDTGQPGLNGYSY